MNDTRVSLDEQIRSFAAAVRTHLDDLPEDELDEIMTGLGADLAEQAADNDGVLDLGDPGAYAEELRSAAGLPPRGAPDHELPVAERFAAWRRRTTDSMRRSVFGAWLLDLAVTLRPVWWVLRGYGFFVVLRFFIAPGANSAHWMVPDSALEWLVILVLALVSVQWGRGLWLPRNPLRHIRTVFSVVAGLALLMAIPSLLSPRVEYVYDEYPNDSGLLLDGVQVGNIFAYDADGQPLEQVQLYTDKGTPLNLYGENGWYSATAGDAAAPYGLKPDGTMVTIPGEDFRGRPLWNVYPLDEAEADEMTLQPRRSTAERPLPPFLRAPGVGEATPTPTPEAPAPGATPDAPAPVETPVP
ncbi:hypothetical protein [uncultured Microbacterium sp.]|uniref:hypothetical protein n=1 Tax=uncultured Microbacterium sp. TaxID=191216 RepID=UPI0028DBCD3F|nr:hypothetical protein [uncultured Microbacterium sp.]